MTDPNGAAIYGAPWIPSKKPSHVSMNIPAPAGSVMGIGTVTIPTDELIFFRGVGIPPTSNGWFVMLLRICYHHPLGQLIHGPLGESVGM